MEDPIHISIHDESVSTSFGRNITKINYLKNQNYFLSVVGGGVNLRHDKWVIQPIKLFIILS